MRAAGRLDPGGVTALKRIDTGEVFVQRGTPARSAGFGTRFRGNCDRRGLASAGDVSFRSDRPS